MRLGTNLARWVPVDAVGAGTPDQWLQCQWLNVNDESLIDPDRLHRQAERDATRSFNRQQPIHTSHEPFWQGTGFAGKSGKLGNNGRSGPCRSGANVAAAQHLGANQAARLSSG